MSISIRSLSLVAVLGVAPLMSFAQSDATTTVVEFDCAKRFALTPFHQRVVARQEEGPRALRNYLYITRGMHSMNFEEATRLAERVHARQRACSRFALDAPRVEATN